MHQRLDAFSKSPTKDFARPPKSSPLPPKLPSKMRQTNDTIRFRSCFCQPSCSMANRCCLKFCETQICRRHMRTAGKKKRVQASQDDIQTGQYAKMVDPCPECEEFTRRVFRHPRILRVSQASTPKRLSERTISSPVRAGVPGPNLARPAFRARKRNRGVECELLVWGQQGWDLWICFLLFLDSSGSEDLNNSQARFTRAWAKKRERAKKLDSSLSMLQVESRCKSSRREG